MCYRKVLAAIIFVVDNIISLLFSLERSTNKIQIPFSLFGEVPRIAAYVFKRSNHFILFIIMLFLGVILFYIGNVYFVCRGEY